MRFLTILPLFALLSFFASGCKKEKVNEKTEPFKYDPSVLYTGEQSDATTFHGYARADKRTFIKENDTSSSESISAFFSNDQGNNQRGVEISAVLFNNKKLKQNVASLIPAGGLTYDYYDSVDVDVTHGWSVNGGQNYPSFNYQATMSWPTFSINPLPSILSKSATHTIVINNVQNVTSAHVGLLGDIFNENWSLPLTSGSNTIDISAWVTQMDTSSNVTLTVYFENSSVVKFNDKHIVFKKVKDLVRLVKVVP